MKALQGYGPFDGYYKAFAGFNVTLEELKMSRNNKGILAEAPPLVEITDLEVYLAQLLFMRENENNLLNKTILAVIIKNLLAAGVRIHHSIEVEEGLTKNELLWLAGQCQRRDNIVYFHDAARAIRKYLYTNFRLADGRVPQD